VTDGDLPQRKSSSFSSSPFVLDPGSLDSENEDEDEDDPSAFPT
jgi:hypothetical protein